MRASGRAGKTKQSYQASRAPSVNEARSTTLQRDASISLMDALAFDKLAARLCETPRAKHAWTEFAAAARASGRNAEALGICARLYDADPTFVTALKTLLALVSD